MECFLILCLTSCYAEAVIEVVDGFFYIYPDFISAVPFFGASGRSGIGTEILFRAKVNHPSAAG